MPLKTSVWVVMAALGAVGGWAAPQPAMAREKSVVMATPMGVTIQTLVAGPKSDAFGGGGGKQWAYADAKGMTLYTYDKDTEANKSTCYDDCAKAWPALAAPKTAKPFGEWSVVTRNDGGTQWAHRGKPLYTFVKDVAVGDSRGVAPTGRGVQPEEPKKGAARAAIPTDGATAPATGSVNTTPADELNPWHVALFQPNDEIVAPYGIAVREVADAAGQVLVDIHGMTLYTFDGDPNRDKPACRVAPCASHWIPLATAQLANPTGDFTLVSRKDGIKQWAYKGEALYTFDGDLSIGDANGIGVDKHWHVALLKQYYLPPQARIQNTVSRGKVIATADGMTLYRRNSYSFQVTGHALPHGVAINPAIGRAIGTRGCDAACTKTWIPFKAPVDAQSAGFWGVMTRDDGSKQWSYKGYALYRYAGDKKPGDVKGGDSFDIFTNNGLQQVSDTLSEVASEVKTSNQTGLYWSHMYP